MLIPRATLSGLLSHQPYRQYAAANLITTVGSGLTPVAIAVGVTRTLHSASSLGVILAAYSAPQVLFLLVGGVWADRWSRRSIMMCSDVARGCAQALLGVGLLTGAGQLWLLVLLQFVCGAATAVFMPAAAGMRLEIAPPELLQQANAVNALIRTTSGVAGPLIAGLFLLFSDAGWLILLDSATFFLSWLCLSRIRLPRRERPADGAPASFRADLVAGWRMVRGQDWIWTSIGCFMAFNLCFAAVLVLGPVTVTKLDHGSAVWGAVMAALSAGQIIGNAVAVRARPRYPLVVGRYVLLLSAPLMVLLGLRAPAIALVCASALCGFAVSFPDVLWETALQRHVDERSLSRISSFDYFGSNVLRPLGLATFGLVGAATGAGLVLVVAGGVVVGITALSLLSTALRTVTTPEAPDWVAAS